MRVGIVMLLATTGLGGCMAMPDLPTIDGTARSHGTAALPPGAVFDVYLEDVARADSLSGVVGVQEIDSVSRLPISFSLPYDPAKIDQSGRYAVRATVTVGDELLLTTNESYPVLTQGNGATVDLMLHPASTTGAAAAGAVAGSAASGALRLAGTVWTLTALNGQAALPAAGRQVPDLTFEPAEGRFYGQGGCNRISGGFLPVGDEGDVSIGQIVSTKMACTPEGVPTEQAFLNGLAEVDHYAITGDELRLTGDGVDMTFVRQAR
ncbi:MAG TPA: YbaY family lipoprotein [Geminicoccus sp.]|uniref:YbaY family lipoprotein n=1 Tax=Geminicoccus sp. TaxID=2024832 RepID=UPI002C10F7C4|nr:YbaY family lipoprotein [Geminicoccus sp.]HWL70322.1 YbaY family lipoprotein [Geminicoccus sp.]